MWLLTYLPTSRISDIDNYFRKNVEIVKPDKAIVYVDGEGQTAFETRNGEWHDRTSCLMQIFLDLKKENFESVYIIDSDNLLQRFPDIGEYYTVCDEGCAVLPWFQKRTSEKGFKLYRTGWKSPFFLGPKQGMRFSKAFIDSIDSELLVQMQGAMKKIHPSARNYLADEQSLAMLFYYSGYRHIPWITNGVHHRGKRTEIVDYVISARVHSIFARELLKGKFRKELFWYYIRNKIALIGRSFLT